MLPIQNMVSRKLTDFPTICHGEILRKEKFPLPFQVKIIFLIIIYITAG